MTDVSDRLRFFGSWLTNPRQTASIAPSSRDLARAMLAELPDDAQRVIELGGGTGAITELLAEHGLHGPGLMVVELNAVLHARLQQQYPQAHVMLGDAAKLPLLAEQSGYAADGKADAVLSSLGMLTMDRATQSAILGAAFTCMAPHGRFIQFTYGPVAPINSEVLVDLGLNMRRGAFVLRNVPPATLWILQRSRARAVPPRSMSR